MHFWWNMLSQELDGAAMLGMELRDLFAAVIQGMRDVADSIGLRGNVPQA